jgi:adenine-specific DNA-methyltransferase
MKNSMIKDFNSVLDSLEIKDHIKEEMFIYFLRKAVLKKHGISHDSYMKFLFKCFGHMDERIMENDDLEEKVGKLSLNVDLLILSNIFDEYLNDKKREMTGSYYTPTYIVELMVSNSIKTYLEENTKLDDICINKLVKDEVIVNISDFQLRNLLDVFTELKIVDISCGSGLFLNYIFEKIFSIKTLIYKALRYDYDEYYEKKSLLENNIFGMDIQQTPLEIVALKYIDILAFHKDFNLESLHLNLYRRNTLLGNDIFEDGKVREIIDEGGFDIVIGNPPYIGEKGNKELFENIKKYDFGKKYYEAKMDYFYYFIYRGIDILKDNGVLSYITTNYFITADGAKKLRKFLREKTSFKNIINFNEYEIFKSAKGQHNMIFTITKGAYENKHIDIRYIKKSSLKTDEIIELLNKEDIENRDISTYSLEKQRDLYSENGNIMIFPEEKYSHIVKKIRKYSELRLGQICNINQGIVSGGDKVTKRMMEQKLNKEDIKRNNITLHKGIFVLNREEIIEGNMDNCKLLKPFYKNSNIDRYFTANSTDKYILYFTNENISNSEYCDVIQNHLKKFQDILNLRRETRKGTRKWFALQWGREQRIFEGPKIVAPQRALQNRFGYDDGMWYASADVYFITPKNENVDLKLLLSILNSKIIYFWLYNMGKRKGDYLELYSNPLAQIPIKLSFDIDIKEDIIQMTNEMISKGRDNCDYKAIEEHQNKIDNILYKIFDFTEDEIETITKLYFDRNNKKR